MLATLIPNLGDFPARFAFAHEKRAQQALPAAPRNAFMTRPASRQPSSSQVPKRSGYWLLTILSSSLKPMLYSILAALLLVYLAPLLCIATVAVWAEGGRPAFVARCRVGRGGAEFDLLRFRTTDELGHLTRLGTILRRTGVDCLPALFNVLRGEMSLVGLRPLTRAELFALGAEARASYLATYPGLIEQR
jgi:lipopolysaccharide/colanic/teichoic acid biosynthesis glycosyltransferase